MTKTTTAFLFAASMLFTTACDPAEEPISDRAAELDIEIDGEAHDGKHGDGKHGDHSKLADRLCSELECTDAQAVQIAELFASKHERRDDGDREAHKADRAAHKAARAEADKIIAAAFRADVFDPAVLERAKPERAKPEHDGDHDSRMLEFATELHAILTPAQRAKLADHVASDGPMFFMGKRTHGKRGSHGEGPDADSPHGDPAKRVAHHVERLCEKVTCTAEQSAQLTQAFTAAHEARRAAHEQRQKPDLSAVAALLRADTLDTAKLAEEIAAAKADHHGGKAERDESFAEVVVAVHSILTPEQRAIIAGVIEADGVRALMGGKHGKGGKRGKGDKRGKGHERG